MLLGIVLQVDFPQQTREFPCGNPPPGISFQHAEDQVFKRRGNLRCPAAGRKNGPGTYRLKTLQLAARLERVPACQELVEYDSQRENIGRRLNPFTAGLLRRHIP